MNAGLYGITDRTQYEDLHGMLFDAVIILNAINAFTLCLSLNHQRKYPGKTFLTFICAYFALLFNNNIRVIISQPTRYRSSAPSSPAPQVTGSVGKEAEPLIPKMEVVKRMLDPIEIVFFILFTASLVLYYVALLYVSPNLFSDDYINITAHSEAGTNQKSQRNCSLWCLWDPMQSRDSPFLSSLLLLLVTGMETRGPPAKAKSTFSLLLSSTWLMNSQYFS